MPAYQAMVPGLVPREDLTNAIALNSAQFNISRVLGPTIGGFAMAWFGIAGNYLLNGISFLAVIIALLRISYPAPTSQGNVSWLENLGEGLRYVVEQRLMLMLLLMMAIASIFGLQYIMFIPLFAKDILHLEERGLGLLMACSGLGAFMGAVTIAYMGRIRGKFVIRAAVGFYLGVIVFSLSHWLPLSAVVLVITGYFMILMVATVNSLLQHLSSDVMRGRVMSIFGAALMGFAPIGAMLAGSLAGSITAPRAIAIMAFLALVASLVLYQYRPELKNLE